MTLLTQTTDSLKVIPPLRPPVALRCNTTPPKVDEGCNFSRWVFFYVSDVFLNQGLIKGDGVALVINQISLVS